MAKECCYAQEEEDYKPRSSFFKVTVGKAVTGQGHRSWAIQSCLQAETLYAEGTHWSVIGNGTGRICASQPWEPSQSWKYCLMPELISETRPCKQAVLVICYFYISFTLSFFLLLLFFIWIISKGQRNVLAGRFSSLNFDKCIMFAKSVNSSVKHSWSQYWQNYLDYDFLP